MPSANEPNTPIENWATTSREPRKAISKAASLRKSITIGPRTFGTPRTLRLVAPAVPQPSQRLICTESPLAYSLRPEARRISNRA
jgi:hypothetical protein